MNLLEFYDSIGRVNRVLYPSPRVLYLFLSSLPLRSLAALVQPLPCRISLEFRGGRLFGNPFKIDLDLIRLET